MDEILPPPPPDPPTESAWERGLRHAKEVNGLPAELPSGACGVFLFLRSLPFAF